jgi:hypothetical protein
MKVGDRSRLRLDGFAAEMLVSGIVLVGKGRIYLNGGDCIGVFHVHLFRLCIFVMPQLVRREAGYVDPGLGSGHHVALRQLSLAGVVLRARRGTDKASSKPTAQPDNDPLLCLYRSQN